jgi:hypothetical protein
MDSIRTRDLDKAILAVGQVYFQHELTLKRSEKSLDATITREVEIFPT